MRSFTSGLAVVLLAILGFSPRPVLAGDEASKARENAKVVLDAQKGVREELLGTSSFALIMGDRKNVGRMRITVEKAEAASGGTYKATSEFRARMGSMALTSSCVILLDEGFSLVSKREESSRPLTSGGEKVKELVATVLVQRQGDQWTCGVQTPSGRLAYSSPSVEWNYSEFVSLALFCRCLDLARPSDYELTLVEWPDPYDHLVKGTKEDRVELGASSHVPVVIHVKGETSLASASGPATGYEVSIRAGKSEQILGFSREKTLISYLPEAGQPVRFFSVPPDQMDKDLPTPGEAVSAGSPKDVVLRWVRIKAGIDPASNLDDILLWDVFHELDREVHAGVKEMTLDQFKESILEWLSVNKSPIPENTLASLASTFEVVADGTEAKVVVMGAKDKPFRLRQVDGRWKIIHFHYNPVRR